MNQTAVRPSGLTKIIPAIDIIGGKCVRLSEGDYDRCKVYGDDPLETAKAFEDHGADLLHLVDLEGAKAQQPVNLRALESIAGRTSLKVEFGGGIKTSESATSAFDAGAWRIIGGSIACKQPEVFTAWLEKFGGKRVVLGADVRDGKVAVNGWLDKTEITAGELLRSFLSQGLNTVIVTDISKDGMLAGPAVELYRDLMAEFPAVEIIASGGVGSMEDIQALDRAGVPAVVVGKALYEGRLPLTALGRGV